jgi:hypothetical protein
MTDPIRRRPSPPIFLPRPMGPCDAGIDPDFPARPGPLDLI